jgi:hypothetical protein
MFGLPEISDYEYAILKAFCLGALLVFIALELNGLLDQCLNPATLPLRC